MIRRSAAAGPVGLRRSCSQFCKVLTLTPMKLAKSPWESCVRSRIAAPPTPATRKLGDRAGREIAPPFGSQQTPPKREKHYPHTPPIFRRLGSVWCDPIVMESMSWHLRGGKGSLHGDVNGKTKRGPSAPPSTDKGQHPFPHSLRLPDAGRHHQDRIVPRHRAHHLRPALLVDRPRHLPRMGRRRLQNQ